MTSLVPAMRRFSVLEAAETIISLPNSSMVQMTYDFSKSDFIVTLLEVSHVIKLDEYSLAVALSDTTLRRQSSRIVAGAPFHKETFKFPVSYEDLMDKSLTLQLLGATRIGSASSVLGSTSIDLSTIDPSDDVILWSDIELHNASENLGELFVGIQYLPSAERLTVTIHQAKGLPSKEALPNAVAKVYLLQDGKMVKKRKSGVRKNSGNPIWNEALNFTCTMAQLANSQLEIHILDHDRIGNHKLIGQVLFGAGDRNDRMWKDLLANKTVNPRWIPLRLL
ncbi:unnamed protein product, partial [Mesorhabditis spiculigera]